MYSFKNVLEITMESIDDKEDKLKSLQSFLFAYSFASVVGEIFYSKTVDTKKIKMYDSMIRKYMSEKEEKNRIKLFLRIIKERDKDMNLIVDILNRLKFEKSEDFGESIINRTKVRGSVGVVIDG